MARGPRHHEASKHIDLDLDLVKETAFAWIVSDGERTVALPKSITQYNGNGNFTVPEWLALNEGLI